jgi:enterochelin esterase-like enzyme
MRLDRYIVPLASLLCLLCTWRTHAQPVQPESLEQGFVIVVEDKARIATTESPILLASNHNGWNPNDPTQTLTRRSDGRWQIVRAKPMLDSRLSFKFTRGSWESSEVDANLQEIENRLLPLIDTSTLKPGELPVVELVIENWKDQRPPEPDLHRIQPGRDLEVTGDVRRLEVVLLGRSRDLLVWLPPGYHEPAHAAHRYPLVFMLDGQTAFEHVPALEGEWNADGIATALIDDRKISPPIIVAIPGPHTPEARKAEYALDRHGPGLIRDLVREAAPRIRRAFRADDAPALIIGAGLAGTLASHAAASHAETFGPAIAIDASNAAKPESDGVPFDPSWQATLEEALVSSLAPGRPSGIPQPGVMREPELLSTGVIIVVVDKSGKGTQETPIYLASNHNGWNPGDPAFRMTPRSDSKWQVELPPSPDGSRLNFKFTLGSWETVEVTADINDISNRTLPMIDAATLKPGEKPVLEFVVEQFREPPPDQDVRLRVDPYRAITIAEGGTLRRLEVVGGGVNVRRDLLVWLPPGYDKPENATRQYPVLYLHDGQNIFEKLPHVPGEWKADETATRLINAGAVEPMIIVAIPSVGMRRIEEYLPVPLFDGIPASGEAHAHWVVHEVMPRVERAFRARTDRLSTFVGGASLGAVISLYIATEYPDRFGSVLLESPPLLAKDGLLMRFFEGRSGFPTRAFVGVGGLEVGRDPSDAARNKAYVQAASELYQLLGTKGITEADRLLVIEPEHVHNEDAWAERFPAALEFLFPPMISER